MDFTVEEIEKGKKLFASSCDFVLGVAQLEQLPVDDRKEIAFAGRSNVGKSSLINALTSRKGLAKTSNTPGRTQQMNYFNLADKMYVVDLPGYGYAQAPEAMVREWQKMIFTYLQGRASLSRVFLLIDSRHGLKKLDLDIMALLDKAAVTYQVVLTKIDKISKTELATVVEAVNKAVKTHPAAFVRVGVTSSEKNIGIEELRAEIGRIAE